MVGSQLSVKLLTDNRLPTTAMLSRRQRLCATEFNRVFEQGRVLRHPYLHVRVLERKDETHELRAAFVAPKKLGKATIRNGVRRRVRERFRLMQAEYSGQLRHCDLVWIIGEACAGASTVQIDEALRELLKRVGKHVGRRVDKGVDKNLEEKSGSESGKCLT